jgi:hypothetical protein
LQIFLAPATMSHAGRLSIAWISEYSRDDIGIEKIVGSLRTAEGHTAEGQVFNANSIDSINSSDSINSIVSDDLAYIPVMHFKIFGNCPLSIAVFLDRFRYPEKKHKVKH